MPAGAHPLHTNNSFGHICGPHTLRVPPGPQCGCLYTQTCTLIHTHMGKTQPSAASAPGAAWAAAMAHAGPAAWAVHQVILRHAPQRPAALARAGVTAARAHALAGAQVCEGARRAAHMRVGLQACACACACACVCVCVCACACMDWQARSTHVCGFAGMRMCMCMCMCRCMCVHALVWTGRARTRMCGRMHASAAWYWVACLVPMELACSLLCCCNGVG